MDIPVLQMIMSSGWVARIILIILSLFSIFSWAIIINRIFSLNSFRKAHDQLLVLIEKASMGELSKIDAKLAALPSGSMAQRCGSEYERIITDASGHKNVRDWSFFLQNQFDMADDHLESAYNTAISRLDRGIVLLAIISSVAPFLGLLGTVWGIMNSFHEIGMQGSASLPVVAPGIAEALITTIVGLFVAIPAVFFYNLLSHRATRFEESLDQFREKLFTRLKRDVFRLLYGGQPTGSQPVHRAQTP